MKLMIKKIFKRLFEIIYPNLIQIEKMNKRISSIEIDVVRPNNVRLYKPYVMNNVNIGEYTYISKNSNISRARIGKFCSIGPNFLCGYGIHPIHSISTSPMFYSTLKQNGESLSKLDKIQERKEITIGNDVFIGANVTVLDGVNIGHGAVIGAGAVVSKNIPPYAVAVGCPIKIIKYRFDEDTINRLLNCEWWDWNYDDLSKIEKYFFDVDAFLSELNKSQNP